MNKFEEVETYKKFGVDLDDILDGIKYDFEGYIPKKSSIKFIEFCKLIEGGEPENKTPVVHYKVLDNIFSKGSLDDAVLCHRGFAKSTIAERLYWYIACFGSLPEFGWVDLSLYISDSIDNGVKTMKTSMDIQYENSDFLQQMLPKIITTDIENGETKKGFYSTQKEIVFRNANNKLTYLLMFGAQTGVRGTRRGKSRPQFAIFDDLIQKEEDARSEPTVKSVESTVYSDVEDALHPRHRKQIWFGTPFNQNDPLYQAVTNGAWRRSVYPVCLKFPCKKEEFIGSWEDRFTWNAVQSSYLKRKRAGKEPLFYREMMLRISPTENRLVKEEDIVWFSRDNVLENRFDYNYYITTDFATSEKKSADNSVINVWAINENNDKMLIDGKLERCLMNKNIDDLFRFCKIYKPLNVGIEVTGQQGGFVEWIRDEMIRRNIYFNLSEIRPTKNKFERFMLIQPQFSMKKIWLPKELKNTEFLKEITDELKKITISGFNSKHDDALDAISMLNELEIIAPSVGSEFKYNKNKGFYEIDEDEIIDANPLII